MPSSSAVEVTGQYSSLHRALEIAAIVTCAVLSGWLCWRLGRNMRPGDIWIVALATALGYIAADLVSGIVHWAFDTLGSPDTPIVGASFIKPFRDHHADASSITRHD